MVQSLLGSHPIHGVMGLVAKYITPSAPGGNFDPHPCGRHRRLAHAATERTFPVGGQFGTVAQWPCSTWERRGPLSLARGYGVNHFSRRASWACLVHTTSWSCGTHFALWRQHRERLPWIAERFGHPGCPRQRTHPSDLHAPLP